MADSKLTYWQNWVISGQHSPPTAPDEPYHQLCELRNWPYIYDSWRLSEESEYLIYVFNDHPRPLEDSKLVEHFIKWSNLALKETHAREVYQRLHKAIRIDGQRSKLKTPEEWAGLKSDICEDFAFFQWMLDERLPEESDDNAITRYLGARCEKEHSNHRTIYYAYNKIYRRLIETLSCQEAFFFLETAAQHVNEDHAMVFCHPGNREMMFIKLVTNMIINP